jgi:hypothetical protein
MSCLIALTRLCRLSPGLLPSGSLDYARFPTVWFARPAVSRRPALISEDFSKHARQYGPAATGLASAGSISEGRRCLTLRKRLTTCTGPCPQLITRRPGDPCAQKTPGAATKRSAPMRNTRNASQDRTCPSLKKKRTVQKHECTSECTSVPSQKLLATLALI